MVTPGISFQNYGDPWNFTFKFMDRGLFHFKIMVTPGILLSNSWGRREFYFEFVVTLGILLSNSWGRREFYFQNYGPGAILFWN